MEALLLIAMCHDAHAAPHHTVALRARRGGVPAGIMDLMFFRGDEPDALPYDRPSIAANIFGLEYTIAPAMTGPGLTLWGERASLPLGAGYFDDAEDPPDHTDGTWLAPSKGFGAWAFGASYRNEIGLTPQEKPVWMSVVFSAGLGLGFRSGTITVWNPGIHPNNTDPTCLPESPAPDRVEVCPDDGELKLPGLLPILDITFGPKLHITEHAMVRLDLGIHNMLYIGGAAGGMF